MILWSSACSASSVGAGTSTKTGSPSVRRSSLKYPGRGTPYGLAKVPVIKVATRSDLARRWHDLMDVNAGRIADGDATIEDVGWELFRLMLNVASGRKKTWAEHWQLHNPLVLFNPAPVT